MLDCHTKMNGHVVVMMDWNLLRSFLAVAETGSLTAAAAQKARHEPTINRTTYR
jgi:hypothetical protein